MNLPEALSRQKQNFLDKAPPATVEIMQSAIDELAKSDILSSCLKNGETAPDFTLEDSGGEPVNLYSTLASGPVILSFFRGDW